MKINFVRFFHHLRRALLNAISSLFFKNIQLFNSEQTFLTFYFVILVIILSRQRYTFFKSEKQIRTRIQ